MLEKDSWPASESDDHDPKPEQAIDAPETDSDDLEIEADPPQGYVPGTNPRPKDQSKIPPSPDPREELYSD